MAHALFVVAAPACQGEVVGGVAAAVGLRPDMFNCDVTKRCSRLCDGKLAVAVDAFADPNTLAAQRTALEGLVRGHNTENQLLFVP